MPIFLRLIQVGDFFRLPNDTVTDVWFWCINMFTFYICKYICKYINSHHASLTNFEFNLIPSGSMYSRRRWSAYANTWSQPTPIQTQMGQNILFWFIDLLYHQHMMKSCSDRVVFQCILCFYVQVHSRCPAQKIHFRIFIF